MSWQDILKDKDVNPLLTGANIAGHAAVGIHDALTEDEEEETNIFGFKKSVLEKVDGKQKKRVKKLLQASQPTKFFGKDMTMLSDLIDELKSLDLMKTDNSFKKKIDKFEEKNLEILASAAEVRKDYEVLYERLRKTVYPKQKKKLVKE
tara:strand:+ start:1876 stop:2322 length:447 start_codon:yes stop_codon:yes gene_type:complete